jgi:hypothetical protein
MEGFNMTIAKMFPRRKLTRELRNEIRAFYDSALDITYDQVIERFGLTRAQVKKILMSEWEG